MLHQWSLSDSDRYCLQVHMSAGLCGKSVSNFYKGNDLDIKNIVVLLFFKTALYNTAFKGVVQNLCS